MARAEEGVEGRWVNECETAVSRKECGCRVGRGGEKAGKRIGEKRERRGRWLMIGRESELGKWFLRSTREVDPPLLI